MNNCTFIGRLTADPEVKTTSSGKALINFSLAVDRDYKNADGAKSESKPQEAAPVAPRKQIEPAEDIDDGYNGLPFPLEDA